MGQRLVITVKEKGEEIAAIYYHWSAYTTSALAEANALIAAIFSDEYSKYESLPYRIIKIMEDYGGGICGEDEKYVMEKWPHRPLKTEGVSRNEGLVAITENGIESLKSWSEGDLIIDLDNSIIDNFVISYWENREEYITERKEWDEDVDENMEIPEIKNNPSVISFDKLDDVLKELCELKGYCCDYQGEIYELIA